MVCGISPAFSCFRVSEASIRLSLTSLYIGIHSEAFLHIGFYAFVPSYLSPCFSTHIHT